jgi:hypothetical protein
MCNCFLQQNPIPQAFYECTLPPLQAPRPEPSPLLQSPAAPLTCSAPPRRHLPSYFTLPVCLCRRRLTRSSPKQRALLSRPRISGGHTAPLPLDLRRRLTACFPPLSFPALHHRQVWSGSSGSTTRAPWARHGGSVGPSRR